MTWLRLGQLAIDLQKAINNCFMCVSLFPFFLYLHYNSLNYPQNCKKSFRKKTLEIHWRVRDCKPTIIYTFLLVFFTIFPLPLSYLRGDFIQTQPTHNLSVRSIFGAWEALFLCQIKSIRLGDAIE